jgi:hypothetical protein
MVIGPALMGLASFLWVKNNPNSKTLRYLECKHYSRGDAIL